MRLLFALLLLLSLPVLVIAHRLHYSASLQGPLFVKVGKALDAPEFAQVSASLNYMDVTLRGRVADLASREKARAQVDDIRGLRCRPSDNFIQVSAKLEGQLTGRQLAISGWLHDPSTLQRATEWLAAARPGIEIHAAGVQISPHVTIEDAPSAASVPVPFRSVWSAIEVPATLRITRADARLLVSGHVTSASLKVEVVNALTQAVGPGAVDASQFESGAYVRHAKFASDQLLPSFLKIFFSTPGAARFEANAQTIVIDGYATPTMQREWTDLLEPMSRETEVRAQLQVHPSVFHFPGRRRESPIEGDALTSLQEVLRASTISFDPGYANADSAEDPKITAVATALIAAGADVRIVAGGHVDLVGNPETNLTMARRRAEGVVADLVRKGVPQHVLETAVFEAVPGGDDLSRRVEFLIK